MHQPPIIVVVCGWTGELRLAFFLFFLGPFILLLSLSRTIEIQFLDSLVGQCMVSGDDAWWTRCIPTSFI
jgi:hypothetical protein